MKEARGCSGKTHRGDPKRKGDQADCARGILSFIEVSVSPEEGVACCLTLAALSPPVEGVMAEVKLSVPGERGASQHSWQECALPPVAQWLRAHGVRDPTCPGLSSCRSPGAF